MVLLDISVLWYCNRLWTQ